MLPFRRLFDGPGPEPVEGLSEESESDDIQFKESDRADGEA